MSRSVVYAVAPPPPWSGPLEELARSPQPVLVERSRVRQGARQPLGALASAVAAAVSADPPKHPPLKPVQGVGQAGLLRGSLWKRGGRGTIAQPALPPVCTATEPLMRAIGEFGEGAGLAAEGGTENLLPLKRIPRGTWATAPQELDRKRAVSMSTQQMKAVFRDLVGKHQKMSSSRKLGQWLPALLKDAFEATAGSPSPHPLRVAVCVYAVERMIDYHQLERGRELRRELVSASFAGGLAMDEMMPNGISASVLERLLLAEAADIATTRASRLNEERRDIETGYQDEIEVTNDKVYSMQSGLKRTFFRIWRDVVRRNWTVALRRLQERSQQCRQLASTFQRWRGFCSLVSRQRAAAQHEKAIKTARDDALREAAALRVSFDTKVREQQARIHDLEEKLAAGLGVDQAKADEYDMILKRCSELETKLKQLQKQIDEMKERNVLLSLESEELREQLNTAAELVQGAHSMSLGNQTRPGLRAVDLVAAANNPEHDMKQPLPETSGSVDDLQGSLRASPSDILLVWVNHILCVTDANSRVVRSWRHDFADGEVFLCIAHYLWPNAAGLLELRNEHSLPERVGGLCSHLKALLGQELRWLRREAVLAMREEVNVMITATLFECYCSSHVQRRPAALKDTSQLKAEKLLDHLMAAADDFELSMANTRAMARVGSAVHDRVFGTLQQMAEDGVRRKQIQDRRGSQEQLRHGWADMSDEQIQAAAPSATPSDCDAIRDSLFEHADRVRQVYQFYSNVSAAMQGILPTEWTRLCADVGFGRTLQARGKLDQLHALTIQARSGNPTALKGASLSELAALLVRIAEDPEGDMLPPRSFQGLVSDAEASGAKLLPRRRSRAASIAVTSPQGTLKMRMHQVMAELARAQHADLDAYREVYRQPECQMVLQTHNRSLVAVYEWFAKRDETNRGNVTSINADEWTRMLKDLDCIDAQLGVKDATMIFNAVQDVEDPSPPSELSFREFLEALCGVALSRLANQMLPVWLRLSNFFQDKFLPTVRRKFPMIKTQPIPGPGGVEGVSPARRRETLRPSLADLADGIGQRQGSSASMMSMRRATQGGPSVSFSSPVGAAGAGPLSGLDGVVDATSPSSPRALGSRKHSETFS
eukprot:TRINITY_DN43941_c0_g1_i1.p1 TRINITY_DN43941_c0_g1~~TRINITY_DN43941_c0_g1_i1.p1  ORF type:complete len:1114 (+),score=364.58 TRINITY_DN43941_c0_g1_i1:43-3384(+)